ncbi:hypothetical protein [Desulfobacter latus]|uniref:Uncharacterized protein n=1 Tax=Desulfobacter latus TaxID=2292 RepID=A0A850T8R0_9BACT|nr:hypothetical protein [Desulfobacter latus]NWH04838.1 hypothetical protein [Desulfobacter latus]
MIWVGFCLVASPGNTAPNTINFQGILKDISGQPIINPSLSMTFSFFNISTGGTAVWTETLNTAVSDGRYHVVLGNQTPITADVLSNDDLWIEIAVEDDTLSPRQKIHSVPFALQGAPITGADIQDGSITDSDLGFSVLQNPHGGTFTAKQDLKVYHKVIAGNPEGAGSGEMSVLCPNGTEVVEIEGDDDGGEIKLRTGAGETSVGIYTSGSGDGYIRLYDGAGENTVVLDGKNSDGGALYLSHQDGDKLIALREYGNAGYMEVMNETGSATVTIDGDYQGGGRIRINGQTVNDYAEYFNLTDADAILPGMVVSINPEDGSSLMLTNSAYDKKVAGIISGANGMRAGMVIGQENNENRDKPLAVSGMVYGYVDATNAPVDVGDLLTSSEAPGYAMKATDRDRAFGAIVGKAMESLPKGKQLIRILVTLQ